MNKIKKGFSLIEVMVVITLIGILSTIAIPAYQTHVVKTRLAELIAISNILKIKITRYYVINSTYPTSISSLGYASSTDLTSTYLQEISMNANNGWAPNGGYFQLHINSTAVIYNNTFDGKVIYLGFRVIENVMTFACGNFPSIPANSLEDKYMPPGCNEDLDVFHGNGL